MASANSTITVKVFGDIEKYVKVSCDCTKCKFHADNDDYCLLKEIDISFEEHSCRSFEERY